jgi:hypothetical protein
MGDCGSKQLSHRLVRQVRHAERCGLLATK